MELSRESQTSMTTSEFDHHWRWEMTQGLHESGIVEGLRSRKLDFPNICNLFHRFFKYIKRLFARQCYWFISFVILCMVNEGDFSRPAPTRFSPLLFMFLWILFLPCEGGMMAKWWRTPKNVCPGGYNRRQNCWDIVRKEGNIGEQKNPHPSPVHSIQSWGVCCFL